jgi:hypothetical protein
MPVEIGTAADAKEPSQIASLVILVGLKFDISVVFGQFVVRGGTA